MKLLNTTLQCLIVCVLVSVGCAMKPSVGRQANFPEKEEDLGDLIAFFREAQKWSTNRQGEIPIQYDIQRLFTVRETFCDWASKGLLPGVKTGEEATIWLFPVWDEKIRAEWLSGDMMSDVTGVEDLYLAILEFSDRTQYYLIQSAGTNAFLVAGYEKTESDGMPRKLFGRKSDQGRP